MRKKEKNKVLKVFVEALRQNNLRTGSLNVCLPSFVLLHVLLAQQVDVLLKSAALLSIKNTKNG